MSTFGNDSLSSQTGTTQVRLAVKGLTRSERLLLEGVVRLGERDKRNRALHIALVPEGLEQDADVLLVDAADPAAMGWARQRAWLAKKPVIWVDCPVNVPSGHTLARRPLSFPVLPVLLTKAMDLQPRGRPAAAPVADANRRPKLLVVDDSTIARTQIRSLLSLRNCDAVEASSVQEAVVLLAKERFDCVFMDVLMPGTDGYEGCRQIRAMRRDENPIPVLMLTSKGSPFDKIRGKMAGCDAYLVKPVDPQQLDDALMQFAPGARRLNLQLNARPPLGAIHSRPATS
jgi:twitching motility two-component system response regulator PilG